MPDSTRVLTATWLEYWAARTVLPRERVEHRGIALSDLDGRRNSGPIILCGLAGALGGDLAEGTVFIPDRVAVAHHDAVECDPDTVQCLLGAAARLHLPACSGSLLTAPDIITGAARLKWARRGFDAVDMETGLLARAGHSLATVRVILDGPSREISDLWLTPRRALSHPSGWRDLLWLAHAAPVYSRRAALVVREALDGRLG